MGNIFDIPPEFLHAYAMHDFLRYISSLPLSNRRKVEIIAEWQKLSGVKIPQEIAITYGIFYNV